MVRLAHRYGGKKKGEEKGRKLCLPAFDFNGRTKQSFLGADWAWAHSLRKASGAQKVSKDKRETEETPREGNLFPALGTKNVQRKRKKVKQPSLGSCGGKEQKRLGDVILI